MVGACFRHIPEGAGGVLARLPGALGALSAPKAEGELTGWQGLINAPPGLPTVPECLLIVWNSDQGVWPTFLRSLSA